MDFRSKATASCGRKPAASVDGSVRPRHHYSSPGNDLFLAFPSLRLVSQGAPAVLLEPLLRRHYPFQLQQDPIEDRVHQLDIVALASTALYSPIHCPMTYFLLVCSEFERKSI